MFRTLFCSKSSLSLSVKHSRSLSRYSESYLHTHDHQLYATPSINYCHLFILTLLFFSDSFMMTSSIPLFYNYFQSDYGPVGISLLFTVYSFFTIISNPLSSFLIDRKGPKIPLMYGVILLILATVLFILSFNFQSDKIHSYGILIVAQSLHGMASPLIQGSGLSLITMSHANEKRLYSVKIITSISLLGYLLGPLFSGLLYSHLNSLSVYIPPAILISIAFFSFLTVFNAGHSILINEMTDEDAEIAIGLLPSAHSQHHPPSSTSVSHNQIHSHSHQSIATSFYGKQRIENFYSFLNLFLNKFHLITFISSLLSTLLLGVLFPLSPIYLHEQFHLNIFQQGLALTLLLLSIALLSPLLSYFIDKTSVSSLNSYSYHETVHSANQLTALTQYQAIYIGLLLVGLALCCMVWVTNIYVWVAVWLSLGIGFTILTIPLMRFFGEIAEWKGYEDYSTASFMYDLSTSLGFTIGPLIGSSLQVALGGGVSGFTRTCFILGIVYSLYSMSVLHLRSVGRRLGEDSLELEGSLYGRSLLDANDPSDLHFFTSTSFHSSHAAASASAATAASNLNANSSLSPSSSSRNLFESSFRDNLFSSSGTRFSLGLSNQRDEDSAVF